MPRRDTPFNIGQFWLSKQARSDNWCRTWYDTASEQTRRASLGTADLHGSDGAIERLTDWYLQHHRPHRAASAAVTVDQVLMAWYEDKGKHQARHVQNRIACDLWSKHLGTRAIDDLTPPVQTQFHDTLFGLGHSRAYVSATLAVGRAALNHAARNQIVLAVPFIADVETTRDKRQRPPKGRPLTLDEIARLLNAADSERAWLFLVIMVNTMCRPDAALDLSPFQIDWSAGLIDLNPDGRRQTNKHRPIVPMTRTIRPWLQRPTAGRFVHYNGKPLTSIRMTWNKLRRKAGFGDDHTVQPYSIRHTMGRELRRRRVPSDEIELMYGHRLPGSSRTTEIYAPYDPDYCSTAIDAIDDLCEALQDRLDRQLIGPSDSIARVSFV